MPPMTMTISAFIVKAAPIVGLMPMKSRQQHAGNGGQRTASGEGAGAVACNVDTNQRRGVRAGRDGAHGAADGGVAQEGEHGAGEHQGGNQHQQPVGAHDHAEHSSPARRENCRSGRCRSRPPAPRPAARTAARRWRGWKSISRLPGSRVRAEQRMQHVAEQQPAQPRTPAARRRARSAAAAAPTSVKPQKAP